MKIYTRTGDKGKSSLLSGERVFKNDLRIEAYGDVDELNAFIGLLIAALPPSLADIRKQLQIIQSDLFQIGAWLAVTPGSSAARKLTPITGSFEKRIEEYIDQLQEKLPELQSFILPGGHFSAAWAHAARTVCRRAERHTIALAQTCSGSDCTESLDMLTPVQIYLNRLSDYFFVLARYCNQTADIDDVIFKD
ncbi:MAG: cob(I)yrinic acid a,c-diamide adenosyltransferase [Desulfobacteraceae bacterium]|nr:cob(I)yrinic acid a,c-diamide adenosyltransferase [Desulfobacteraceae bacterium]